MLGVRGSTAAPGGEFVRYGGHTSCVAVIPEGSDRPTLVLDAGTGLRDLTSRLDGAAFTGSILLSHLHWDHVQGIPFFVAGDRPDAVVALYVPAQNGRSGRDLLATSMAPRLKAFWARGRSRHSTSVSTASRASGFARPR